RLAGVHIHRPEAAPGCVSVGKRFLSVSNRAEGSKSAWATAERSVKRDHDAKLFSSRDPFWHGTDREPVGETPEPVARAPECEACPENAADLGIERGRRRLVRPTAAPQDLEADLVAARVDQPVFGNSRPHVGVTQADQVLANRAVAHNL